MFIIKQKRIKTLEKQLSDTEERAKDAEYIYGEGSNSYKNAVMRIEECKVLINFHAKHIELANKENQRDEFKRSNCRKCELSKDGECLTGIADILECKETRQRIDEEMGE